MKTYTRDDTEHGIEYVLRDEADAEIERLRDALQAIVDAKGDANLPIEVRPVELVGRMHRIAVAALEVTP